MYVLKTKRGCYDGIGQSRKNQCYDTSVPPIPSGHYAHWYYPTPLLLTANEGWGGIFPQLLAFSPFVNNSR